MKPHVVRLIVVALIVVCIFGLFVMVKGAILWYKANNAPPYRGRVYWEEVLYSKDIARDIRMGITMTVAGFVFAVLSGVGALLFKRQLTGGLIPLGWLTEARRPGFVLALGIMGIVFFPGFGIVAWIMGNRDLRKMNEGLMDTRNRGLTQAGKICGVIGAIVGGVYWSVMILLEAIGV